MYLNAGVYTGQTDYAKAEEYASKVIASAYKLCTNYSELFMADNDENENAMQEIILPIRQDGEKYMKLYFGESGIDMRRMFLRYVGKNDIESFRNE